MAVVNSRDKFNEATRVQMPALVHLNRLGYEYFWKISAEMAGMVYDPDKYFERYLQQQFCALNPWQEV